MSVFLKSLSVVLPVIPNCALCCCTAITYILLVSNFRSRSTHDEQAVRGDSIHYFVLGWKCEHASLQALRSVELYSVFHFMIDSLESMRKAASR